MPPLLSAKSPRVTRLRCYTVTLLHLLHFHDTNLLFLFNEHIQTWTVHFQIYIFSLSNIPYSLSSIREMKENVWARDVRICMVNA